MLSKSDSIVCTNFEFNKYFLFLKHIDLQSQAIYDDKTNSKNKVDSFWSLPNVKSKWFNYMY